MDQKIWGETVEIFKNETVSVHYLKIKKGGVCSWHHHKQKYNQFNVLSGAIIIRCGLESHVLKPGMGRRIEPDESHEFEGLEDSQVIETTFVKLDPEDIVRARVGYIKELVTCPVCHGSCTVPYEDDFGVGKNTCTKCLGSGKVYREKI